MARQRTPEEEAELQALSGPVGVPATPSGGGRARTAEEEAELHALEHPANDNLAGLKAVGNGVGQALNIIPGTTRAVVHSAIKQPGWAQAAKDVGTGLMGKYPGSAELYNLSPEEGLAADLAQDIPSIAGATKVATMGAARYGAPLLAKLSNYLRMSEGASQGMDAAVDGMNPIREKLSGLADSAAKGFSNNPDGTWSLGSDAAEGLGKKIHASAFGPLDAEVTGRGPKVSDIFWDNNKGITANGAESKLNKIITGLTDQNTEIASKTARQIGPGRIDTSGLSENQLQQLKKLVPKDGTWGGIKIGSNMSNTDAAMKKFSVSPPDMGAVNQYQTYRDQYGNMPPVSMDRALFLKSRERQAGKAAYGEGGLAADASSQLHQATARDIDRAIENTVRKVNDPDAARAADQMSQNNDQLGSLISAKDAAPGMKKPLFTPTDYMIAGGGLMTGLRDPALYALALKKAAEATARPGPRSYLGLTLKGISKVPALPEAAISEAGAHLASPWTVMPNDKEKRK